jgi:hypothetical protein
VTAGDAGAALSFLPAPLSLAPAPLSPSLAAMRPLHDVTHRPRPLFIPLLKS